MRAALLVMIASACSYPKLPPLAGDNVDAPSVNPSLLSLDDAGPVLLYEGQGTGAFASWRAMFEQGRHGGGDGNR